MSERDPGAILRDLVENVPSIDVRHAFEIAATLTGSKRVVRVVVEPADVEITKSLLLDLGLEVKEAELFLGVDTATSLGDQWTVHVTRNDPRCAYALLFAAREPLAAATAARQEGTADAQEIGRFLGYPECCLSNYARIEAGAEWLTLLLNDHRARAERGQRPSYLTNKIGYLFDGASFLPDYFPCSLHCQGARNIAAGMRTAALGCGLSDLVHNVERVLRRPVVIWRGLVIQPLDGVNMADGRWAFNGETALRFDWQPPAALTLSLLDDVGGCQFNSGGLALLDRRGRPMTAAYDPQGQAIRFD